MIVNSILFHKGKGHSILVYLSNKCKGEILQKCIYIHICCLFPLFITFFFCLVFLLENGLCICIYFTYIYYTYEYTINKYTFSVVPLCLYVFKLENNLLVCHYCILCWFFFCSYTLNIHE